MTQPNTPGQPPADPTAAAALIADGPAAPEAPATPPASPGTSDSPAPSFEAPFNINDVPADQRPYVEAYQRQLQGAYTRKTQELAEQRAALAPAAQLYSQLTSEDEATRDAAVREVLARSGWSVDEPEAEEEPDEPPGHEDPRVAAYEQRLAQLEAAQAARAAQDEQVEQQSYLEDFQERYLDAAGDWAKRNGFQDGYDGLPEHLKVKIAGYVRGTPPLVEGEGEEALRYPDMEAALTMLDAELGAEKIAYLATKDVEAPNTAAVSAQRGGVRADMRDDKKRLAKAMEIAGRHLS